MNKIVLISLGSILTLSAGVAFYLNGGVNWIVEEYPDVPRGVAWRIFLDMLRDTMLNPNHAQADTEETFRKEFEKRLLETNS